LAGNERRLYTLAVIDQLAIYTDRLHGGATLKLAANFAPNELSVDDADVKILRPIDVHGQAYLADSHVIVQLDIATTVSKPCRVCNEDVAMDLDLKEVYWMLPIDEIQGTKIDGVEIVRELLLSEIPPFFECGGGSCPRRPEMERFIHHRADYQPFKDLDL
jgi:uncharacterized metal-binding protein YceD (DUF177 family)